MTKNIKISTNAAKWSLLLVWSNRIIGLFSTLILVKYLTPYDFGVAVTAMMIQGFAQTFTEIGYRNYIIKNNIKDHISISSAWTLSLILKASSGLVIILLAIAARYFYGQTDISNVLIISSILPALSALINPGLVLEEMNDNYKNLSLISIYTKIITFPITVALAIIYQSFWSIVFSGLISSLLNVIISYLLNDFKPKLILHETYRQISFAKNIFLHSILGFLRSRLENFSILYLFGVKINGSYSVIQEFAYLPLTELAFPFSRGFYASASALNTPEERVELLLKYINIGLLILTPCLFGSLAVSDLFTKIVLGELWMPYYEFFTFFCLIAIQVFLMSLISSLFIIYEKFKLIYIIDGLYIISVVCITFIIKFETALIFIKFRAAISFASLGLAFYFVYKTTGINLLFKFISFPFFIISSLGMLFSVLFFRNYLETNFIRLGEELTFVLTTTFGALMYIISIYLLSIICYKKNHQMNEVRIIYSAVFFKFKEFFIKKNR